MNCTPYRYIPLQIVFIITIFVEEMYMCCNVVQMLRSAASPVKIPDTLIAFLLNLQASTVMASYFMIKWTLDSYLEPKIFRMSLTEFTYYNIIIATSDDVLNLKSFLPHNSQFCF